MSDTTSQDKASPNLSEETQEQVQSIASDIDFRPFLEVINADSQRTRAVVFVLVAALLLIFTAYRNTAFPDWTDARLAHLQHAALCAENNAKDTECEADRKYAYKFLVQDSDDTTVGDLQAEKELGKELREQINAFIKQRTDALPLRLPFFGITVDMNDLGLACGLLLIAILFVLYASLKSETDDLILASEKAWDMDDKKRDDNLTLLRMAQVLASPSESKIGVGKGLYVLYLLVPVLQFFVVKSDVQDYEVAAVLEGRFWAGVDTTIDVTAFLAVVLGAIFCIKQQGKLNNTLDDLVKKRDPRKPISTGPRVANGPAA